MRNHYKSALDKLTLNEAQKEKAKALYYETEKDGITERKNGDRKNIWKPVIAVAACLVLIIAVNAGITPGSISDNVSDNVVSNSSDNNPGNGSDAIMIEKYFLVTAYGKELTKGGKVFPDKYSSIGYVLDGSAEKGIGFSFEFPMECKGENIDTITYEIKKGAFHIMERKTEEPDGHADTGADGDAITEKNGSIIVAGEKMEKSDEFYKSFTVNYENQSIDKERGRIDIVDSKDMWTEEKISQYEELEYNILDASVEEEKELFDFLTKDLGITCTVTYKDGSTETKNIIVSNEIVKLSEMFPEEEIPEDAGEKWVIKYFSIQ